MDGTAVVAARVRCGVRRNDERRPHSGARIRTAPPSTDGHRRRHARLDARRRRPRRRAPRRHAVARTRGADPRVDPAMNDLRFLGGYPQSTLDQVRELIAQGKLGDYLARRYPERHEIRNDGALYEHAMALKQRYLKNAPLLSKVAYDNRLQIDQ